MALPSLATLAEYKTYKAINSTTKDVVHTDALKKASNIIRSYCGREFNNLTTITEYFRGDASFYYLTEYPKVTVQTVNISNDGQQTQTALTEGTDYYVDQDTGQIEEVNNTNFSTTSKFKYLEVKYKGGYSIIPEDLKLVCINIADYCINEGFKPRKSTGVHNVDNVNEKQEWPYYIQSTLDIYRNLNL